MRIEEIDSKENHLVTNERPTDIKTMKKINPNENKQMPSHSYWFPLSVGCNRLLCVLCIILTVIVAAGQEREDDVVTAIFVTPIVEFILYLAAIWVYQGFKESSKVFDDNEK